MQPFERLRYLARWSDADDDAALLEEAADCLAGFADDPFGIVIACRRLLAYHPSVAPLWWLCAHVLSAVDAREGAWAAWRAYRSDSTPLRLAGALPFPHESPVAVVGWPDIARDGLAERIDLELLAVRSGRADTHLSRRLRRSVQQVRVIDETELMVLAPTHLLVAPVACGGGRVLVAPGTGALVTAGRSAGAAVWLVVPKGFALPARMLEALERSTVESRREAGPYPSSDAIATGRGDDGVDELPYEEIALDQIDLAIGPNGADAPRSLRHRADCAPAPELLRIT